MPICPHCSLILPAEAFFRNRAKKTGCSTLCKECHSAYEKTPERRVTNLWHTMNARVKKQASYAHVEIRMTREEFTKWALPAFSAWMAGNPGLTPSIDRMESKGHYEIGNVRVIERGENCRLASNHKNVHAPDGMAWCGTHKTYMPREYFQKCVTSFNGLQSRCRDCQNALTRRAPAKGHHAGRPASQG